MVLREGSEAASPVRRTAAQRKQSRLWAKLSADNAVQCMAMQVATLHQRLKEIEVHMDLIYNDPELRDRVHTVISALWAMLRGEAPTPEQRLRRNDAFHTDAAGMAVSKAASSDLRAAQHGKGLEHRGRPLNPLAKEFVPAFNWDATQEPEAETDKDTELDEEAVQYVCDYRNKRRSGNQHGVHDGANSQSWRPTQVTSLASGFPARPNAEHELSLGVPSGNYGSSSSSNHCCSRLDGDDHDQAPADLQQKQLSSVTCQLDEDEEIETEEMQVQQRRRAKLQLLRDMDYRQKIKREQVANEQAQEEKKNAAIVEAAGSAMAQIRQVEQAPAINIF